MILYRSLSWWYWGMTAVLLVSGLSGRTEAFWLTAVLSALQIVHFRLSEGAFLAFPVQVRLVYTTFVSVALLPAMQWLFLVIAVGTIAQVLFGYCLLARCLSLLPGNRTERMSWKKVWRTFVSRPVKGSVLQGLPATA